MKKPQHWQTIYGDFAFEQDRVLFHGHEVPPPNSSAIPGLTQPAMPAVGLAMCDTTFAGGNIKLAMIYENVKRIPTVQIVPVRNAMDNSIIYAGIEGDIFGESLHARFVINLFDSQAATRGTTIRTLSSTAMAPRPPTGQIRLRLFQVGSLMDLYADDVHVLRHILDFSPPTSQCGLFCQSTTSMSIEGYEIDTHARTAFVIMQFSPPFEHLFTEVIRPVADSCGIRAEKADDIAGPGMIISDITRKLQETDIVIADVTPQNANVYYEVGYAHAIGKPTILLAEKGKALPFDVSGFRTLFYENSIAGKSQIEQGLRKHLDAITKERPV